MRTYRNVAVASSLTFPTLALAGALLLNPARAQDSTTTKAGPGPAVPLTFGPVHESLGPASLMPIETNRRVLQNPPAVDPVLERPPQSFPNSRWIDGYWDWHPAFKEFVWIPGVWRIYPPGQDWQSGKWAPAPDGAVRYPGYWFKASQRPTIKRNPPRDNSESLRDGGRMATQKMVGQDGFWVRGHWQLDQQDDYRWEPGYVAANDEGFLWQNAQVVPVVGGYAIVDGFWDYPLSQRGLAYAAMRQPISPPTSLTAIDMSSVTRAATGEVVYTQLRRNSQSDRAAGPVRVETSILPPRPLDRELSVDGTATIQGVVRKGKLMPQYIEVKLVGGTARVTESDEQGRFTFSDIPYGTYAIVAQGPVQNYARRGSISVDVEQPVVKAEIELE